LSDTVPVDPFPPVTVAGLKLRDASVIGVNVRPTLFETPPRVPVINAKVCELTGVQTIVKVADDRPAATVTVAGTAAAVLLLVKAIVKPPSGAGPVRVAVPVAAPEPATVVGLTLSEYSEAGETVRFADCELPAKLAVTTIGTGAPTVVVETVKVATFWPAATVTVDGTVATMLFEESETVEPEGLAGEPKVTVPVDDVPPATAVGLRVNEAIDAGLIVNVACDV